MNCFECDSPDSAGIFWPVPGGNNYVSLCRAHLDAAMMVDSVEGLGADAVDRFADQLEYLGEN